MMTRRVPLLVCVVLGCAGSPASTPPGTTSTAPSSAGGEAGTPDSAPEAFIVSYRPSALWNALSRETMPHGWPDDVELRPARPVEYDPGSGSLRIGPSVGTKGKAKTVSATPSESVTVVWIPDYVPTDACPKHAPADSFLLVTARDSIGELTVTGGDEVAMAHDAPAVVFAAASVEATCAQLSDARWVAEHSAEWRPTDLQKRRHRVVGGGAASEEGRAVHRVLAREAQLQPRPPEPVDFQTHAVIALGEGASMIQHVNPKAIQTDRVHVVDVPMSTTACRMKQAEDLSKLVYLADDTGPEPGHYRVQGSPLFVRQVDDFRHELRFAKCSAVFPHWTPTTTFIRPNPSMYLRLYGGTPRKERGYEDTIVAEPTVTMAGDTANLTIPLQTPIPCPEPGASKKETTTMRTKAHLVRRAVLRRRFSMPYHNGPLRLVTSRKSPYDAVEWDLDAKPCSASRSG